VEDKGDRVSAAVVTQRNSHRLLKKVSARFEIQHSNGWELTTAEAVEPLGFNSLIINPVSKAPLCLYRDYCLLLSISLFDGDSMQADVERVCRNYIKLLADRLVAHDKLKTSLADMLFGSNFFRSDLLSTFSLLLPPRTSSHVSTILSPNGPTRINADSLTVHVNRILKHKLLKDSSKYPVVRLEKHPAAPHVGISKRYKFQDPRLSREKRLRVFLADKDYSLPAIEVSTDDLNITVAFDKSWNERYNNNLIDGAVHDDSRSASIKRNVQHAATVLNEAPESEWDTIVLPPASEIGWRKAASSNSRGSRPISSLSPEIGQVLTDLRRRPVSASVLLGNLPLNLPMGASSHEPTVVLNTRVRPFSSYGRYMALDAKSTATPTSPLRRVFDKEPTQFIGPPFYRYFSHIKRDPLGRGPPTWGPSQPASPEDIIHNDVQKLFLDGPWR
jgi:hypothetical protein